MSRVWTLEGARDPAVQDALPAPTAGAGVIGIVGPDGAGKSTLIEGLTEGVLGGVKLRHMRRPGVMLRRTVPDVPVTEPHKDPPYGYMTSLAKVCYLFADYLLGWFRQVRSHVRSGGCVLIERGWWDMAVDPLRYRLHAGSVPLVRLLGSILPGADVMLVLEAPAEQIHARKQELDVAELDRQARAWRDLLSKSEETAFLDASRPVREVVSGASFAVAKAIAPHPAGWAGLPGREEPRWLLPRAPRRAAARGLKIYQPMTPRGLVAWSCAKAAASLGFFRLLPRARPPLTDGRVLSTSGSVMDVQAAAGTNHPGRYVALLRERSGSGAAIAKCHADGSGRESLGREAAALRDLGPLLPAPMRAPALISSSEGALVLEAVDWRPRLMPWRLPIEVARGLGEFHRAGRSADGSGPAHGDFAPWNLMRVRGGWVVIDWEEARRSAPPYHDLFTYLVQGNALLGHPSVRSILAGLHGRGRVGRAIEAYVSSAGLEGDDVEQRFVAFLKATAPLQNKATPDGRRCIAARAELLQRLGEKR